ncbi:MAG: single-stranded DNA-binding protein [Microbacterium sp. 69-7]|uniref:single-stranded DNA-binding protein n=1 Tax=Microbacterium sp. 69-7 TaxID=1895784 RepID=UPI0009602AEB|nr:single-stranded DNA-binding protein [Microbacterium sp. 69-7]OJU47386.1 MAG: single-stranded DNA-binding protein [Microbacterium sp. 69-7]
MSYITRTGNLAAKPTLREGERGAYTYARVIVTDRIRQEDGSYIDGPATAYDVAVSGSQATNLVEAAEKGGNIRITFSGSYRVTEYKGEQGTRIQHEVRADEVGVSLRGQSVTVERNAPSAADSGDDTPF